MWTWKWMDSFSSTTCFLLQLTLLVLSPSLRHFGMLEITHVWISSPCSHPKITASWSITPPSSERAANGGSVSTYYFQKNLWNHWNVNYSAGRRKGAVEIHFLSAQLVCAQTSDFSLCLAIYYTAVCYIITIKMWLAETLLLGWNQFDGQSCSFQQERPLTPTAVTFRKVYCLHVYIWSVKQQSERNISAVLNCSVSTNVQMLTSRGTVQFHDWFTSHLTTVLQGMLQPMLLTCHCPSICAFITAVR